MKTSKKRCDTLTLSMLIGFIITLFLTGTAAFSENVRDIEDSVLRLHIPANSDSISDQTVKLEVRDAVLELSEEIFGGCETKEESAAAAEKNLPVIEETADRILASHGLPYRSHAEICETDFGDRTYDGFVMPAGRYTALRISLGSGNGRNWWCVMFPTLCLPAAADIGEMAGEDGYFTDEELYILQNHNELEVRFYFADLFEKVCDLFDEKTK